MNIFSQAAAGQDMVSNNSTSKKSGKGSSLHGRWTDEEHRLFIEGMDLFKKDWRSIERHIGTRTCSQIRSHAQKYFMRLDKQTSVDGAETPSHRSNGDDMISVDQLPNPRFQRMASAAPMLEEHSAKKPVHLSRFKTDTRELEQELSQNLT
jgi:SHAQKYF class myb-like DNA-binding protein